METIFVTESREMLFTGTEDIDVRPLHSSELHYEGDSREEALRAAHKVSAASRVGVCQRGFARFVATVSEITRDGEGFTEHMDTVHTVDPLDRMPELRTLAREAAANRADGKVIGHIAGITGLALTCDPATPEELLATFDLAALPTTFDDLVQVRWR